MLDNQWHEELDGLYDDMVEWRRHLHRHPELSFHETETIRFIVDKLHEFGVEVKTGVGGGGIVGTIRGGNPGKTIALRADFDALPIQEETDVPYKSSVPGVMHACGHDGHTATLLGVAKILSRHRDEFAGNVVLLHQHAEECPPGGAQAMIEDGCLDGVDAVFGAHLWSKIPYGTIGYRKGYFMAAADSITIKIQGCGGHGSAPHQAVDSIVIASQIVNQLQMLVSREIDPQKAAVISIGKFHAGTAANAIADSALLEGTVRTFDEDVRDLIEREIGHVVRNVCRAFHADGQVNYDRGYPAVYNHEKETAFFERVIEKTFGKEAAAVLPPQMGAEDFAYYLQKKPGMFFLSGAENSEIGADYPHHHPKFNFDERVMLVTGKAFLSIVHDYLLPAEDAVLQKETNANG